MKLRNTVNGNAPFEGDLTFRWQTIPANAKILKATATVTPVDSKLGGPFTELLRFTNGTGDFGATRTSGTTLGRRWVEVDFHTRRTLARMTGNFGTILNEAGGCELQVDVGGGTYVELNQNGAFRTPSDPPNSFFRVGGNSADLPGLTVAKLKASTRDTNAAVVAPSLDTLMLSSVPTQVSLRVGELAPFFTHVGEMTLAETTADFAAVLQTALTTAKAENGFYDLPITVHSDSIARLKIDLEIEFLAQQEVLPKAVPEVVLPFDASTLTKSKAAELTIEVPFNSKVVAGQTSARVRGSFTETRIAFGPTGADNPTAAVEISSSYSQAQILVIADKVSAVSADREISAVAVDLLLESLTPSARLQLDIRGDFDGKPDEIPLLPKPVEFSIEQRPEKGVAWTTVPLPAEFLFAKAKDRPTRYWLLLQTLEGRAAWSVIEIPKQPIANTTEDNLVNAQRTGDGGLSWQDTSLISTSLQNKKATPPYVALLRLRDKPKIFKMPIKLQVGSGKQAVEKKLDRFEPLGRIDFTLDTELAEGVNEYLQAGQASALPETQHLVNADFEQWERVGERMALRRPIIPGVPINKVAFSPDGTRAYVLDLFTFKDGFLLVIDVDCNQLKERIDLRLRDPSALVIHPDGTRAYVTDGRNLQTVNLETNKVVGVPVRILGEGDLAARDLALSADGRRLYWVSLNISGRQNVVRIFDTASLETAPSSLPAPQNVPANAQQLSSPVAVALSPDESLLYLLVDRGAGGNFVVEFVGTTNFTTANPPSVAVGREATALVVTPDGKRAVVTNMGDNNVSVIDTTTRTALLVALRQPTPSVPNLRPKVVALSPDGKFAYVVNQGSRSINVIDMDTRVVVENFAFQDNPQDAIVEAIAVSPQGDQMYVTNSVNNFVFSIQFGERLPSEWQRTSGEVFPLCMPFPFHLVAGLVSATLPTSISQVVPVVSPFAYEFSFWGIAVEPREDDPPAVAEVLWLNSTCGLLQADSLPIETIEFEGDGQPLEFIAGIASSATEQRPRLILHRAQLTSPAGADQAEVRFSVSRNTGAIIDLVSLAATSELVTNGDFQLKKNDRLVGWNQVPELTPGFRIQAAPEGLQLVNPGGVRAELVQTIAAESEQPFTLQFHGKATATPPSETPRIELRWLDAGGAAMGEPTLLQILPTGVDTAGASGIVPKNSTQVEIHVVVPTKTTLELKRVSLRYTKTTPVPVKFISEAPGDMTVSDVRIAFEQIEPKAPPVGPQGLCNGTPPGKEPGTRGDSCYCHQCEEETLMIEATPVMTEAGRPATMGRCSTCKTEVVRAGGALVVGADALSPQAMSAPVMVSPVAMNRQLAESQALRPAPQLTDIRGIGQARAKQLTEVGIDSVEKLAASTPERVAEIQFITKAIAAQIIAQAKFLT
jgi:DNA-binding beta-propeller fold protein YncE/predicted flap endonuclease-1-like 5' DNA nuclease